MNHQEMLDLLEKILDSKNEFDKWTAEVEKAYIKLGGKRMSLIAPSLRARMEARKEEENA